LSGPQFLVVYGVAFVASMVFALVVRLLVSRIGSRAAGRGAGELSVLQAACLAGGWLRVLDTTIAGLAMWGALHVGRRGQLAAVPGAPLVEPIEPMVWPLAQFPCTRQRVQKRLRSVPVRRAVERDLLDRGLLLGRVRARVHRWVLLLPFAVVVVGVVRLLNGLSLHRPVGDLVAELVFSGFVASGAFAKTAGTAKFAPSPAGRRALRPLRRMPRRPNMAFAPAGMAAGSLVSVAVFGISAIADPSLRAALRTASSSGGGDGGGGSCGGGGCGGGGCGG
jgi:uncharacterized protein (TIGR04222 family)